MAFGILLVLIVIGALLAAVSGIRAVRAWLRYRRARANLQGRLTLEVDDLARKTAEIEKNLAALDARAQQLPVRISEMQQSLSTLKILSGALAATLRQSQQVLSYNARESFGSIRSSEPRRTGNGS